MAETTDLAATKRALRALVDDDVADGDRPEPVVDEAIRATECVERAARFLAADGVDRLARAVAEAVRDGDDETVRRGRESLAALRAFESALDGRVTDDGVGSDAGRPRTDQSAEHAERPERTPDHFHLARGTVLGGDGKRGDR